MPRPRFERLDAPRRARILDAAAAEFAEHGFARASYNQIIQAAGVSKGAMYYYFDDKADLYLTVIRRTFGDLLEVMGTLGAVDDAPGFWAACDAMMGRVMAYFAAEPRRAERARGLVRSLAEAPPQVREVLALAQEPTRALLRAGQAAGAVRADLPVDLLAAMVLGLGEAMDTWLATHWDALPPEQRGAIEGQLMGVFLRLCAP
ncbi:MAG: TetR/AcrR family transcriptional regulator [Myxococcales bacterium]|nr:TetR/AcrR family transcriptional regulator [Myxococcales bacterium]